MFKCLSFDTFNSFQQLISSELSVPSIEYINFVSKITFLILKGIEVQVYMTSIMMLLQDGNDQLSIGYAHIKVTTSSVLCFGSLAVNGNH